MNSTSNFSAAAKAIMFFTERLEIDRCGTVSAIPRLLLFIDGKVAVGKDHN